MSIVRPFRGYRPTADIVSKVAALPYDVMTSAEARKAVRNNPYSFLHIDRAEIDLPEGTDEHDPDVYEKAASNLNRMIKKGLYIQDKRPVLYIYRLTMNGRSQTGIVGCTSIDEYIEGKIKKHELTLEKKEIDRIRHVDACNANTGPIFLTYRDMPSINREVSRWISANSPIYDFVSDDKIGHTVWVINDNQVIEKITKAFMSVDSLYIADGHHRNASAVKVGLMRREQIPNYDENSEFNYYLSVIFPESQLRIMDYNRIVKDLNGMSERQFLSAVRRSFVVEEISKGTSPRPAALHTFGMYLGKKWYLLKAENTDDRNPIKSLDVSILQDRLLTPILGIGDPRNDDRIDFVGGIRGLRELERRVNSGEMKVAFAMYPTTVEQLMSVADSGHIMPPKSTWFEPKPRSGIFIHKLEN